ncbi:MAG: hypothetical protein HY884_10575 [Deltaproteobacteria bacterium]|nr:hypothetical protein [Deltaproteobacteria bacterium]
MAEEFRSLTQDIAASFDVRKGEVESIRQQVSGMIGDFRKTRLHDIKTYNKEKRREVSDLLNSFNKERGDMASAWADLVSSMRSKRGIKAQRPVKKEAHRQKKRAETGA